MKKHIPKPQQQRLPFSGPTRRLFVLTVLIIGLSSMILSGQRTTFHLSQTLEVPQGVLIRTNGPQSVSINGQGVVNTRYLETKYVVSGKGALPYVYVIHKTLEINTWDRNQVKQEVEVTLETATPDQTAQLRNALRPVLAIAAGNVLSLTCELNIAQFSLNNGWFREDRNSITLADGRVFPVKYLEINNRFFVPESASLELKLSRTNLSLDDHTGPIELQQAFGQVSGGCLREMTAQLTDAIVRIDNLDEANLRLTNCELHISQVGKITMNTSLSGGEIDSVGQLLVNKSVSDRFAFRRVDVGVAAGVLFSTFDIGELGHSWRLTGKGATLSVRKVNQVLQSFQVDNQDGQVQFPLQGLAGYKLWCDGPTKNNYQLPTTLTDKSGSEVASYYEFGAAKNTSIVRLSGQRCEFLLRPE